jgi:Domain of unknown function (DUF4145)
MWCVVAHVGVFDCRAGKMCEEIVFYPFFPKELQSARTVAIKAHSYECGACGQSTNARVLATMARPKTGDIVYWAVCACSKSEPTILVERSGLRLTQLPTPRKFHVGNNWPPDLGRLYEEATKSFAASAYTASSMVSRKILMACAVHQGAKDDLSFAQYVDYITTQVLVFGPAKNSIDVIRTIGNDANHDVAFVDRDDASRALSIVIYMLNAIYSLPSS